MFLLVVLIKEYFIQKLKMCHLLTPIVVLLWNIKAGVFKNASDQTVLVTIVCRKIKKERKLLKHFSQYLLLCFIMYDI